MEHGPKSSIELPEWQTLPAPEFIPSPERLQELPPQMFNVEQMKPAQVASLIVALEAGLEAERVEGRHLANSAEDSIGGLTGLLQRDLVCLPARDIEKAREVIITFATHEHFFVRATAGDVIASLFRFQPADDSVARQQVVDVWVGLLQDRDELARESAEDSISQAVRSDWIDEPTARYLNSKLPVRRQREDW